MHDLNHVVTGYATDFAGEAEISAWELASGCFRYKAAFLLDLFGILFGLFAVPRRVVRAWARGRRSGNLYHIGYDEALLQRTVGSVRHELGLHQDSPAVCFADVVGFSLAWLGAFVVGLLLAMPLGGIAYGVRALLS